MKKIKNFFNYYRKYKNMKNKNKRYRRIIRKLRGDSDDRREAMKSYITTLNIELKSVKSENEKLYQENILLKKAIKEAIDYIKTTQYSDILGEKKFSICDFWFIKEILEILERSDK